MTPAAIKPTHKAIQAYYAELKGYAAQGVGHETAVRSAFQNLLAETARARGWTLVSELTLKVHGTTAPSPTTIDLPFSIGRKYPRWVVQLVE